MIMINDDNSEQQRPIAGNVTILTHASQDSHGFGREVKVTQENLTTLDDYLELFSDFLRGIGFHFDGELVILDDEEENLGANPYGSVMEDGKDD